jgi:hypothetical protein
MFKILLIIAVTAAIFCLGFFIACLFVACQENDLPDIVDVEMGEIITSEAQKA